MLLFSLVNSAFRIYEFLILARVLMSWFNPNPYSQWVQMICAVTDPFLNLIAKYMPSPLVYPLDFSPVVALMLVGFLRTLVIRLLVFIV